MCFEVNLEEFWLRVCENPLRKSNISAWWEKIFIPGLKRMIIRFCKHRASELRGTRELLNNNLVRTLRDLNLGTGSWDDYNEINSEIRNWEKQTLIGTKIRGTIAGNIEDEPGTSYHVNKERERGLDSSIKSLEIDGRLIEEKKSLYR